MNEMSMKIALFILWMTILFYFHWERWNVNRCGESVKSRRFGKVYDNYSFSGCLHFEPAKWLFRNSWIERLIDDTNFIFISVEKSLFESQSEFEYGLKTSLFACGKKDDFFLASSQRFFLTAVLRCIDILVSRNIIFIKCWLVFFFSRLIIQMNSEPTWSRIECMLNACSNTECTSCFILINNTICNYIFIVIRTAM